MKKSHAAKAQHNKGKSPNRKPTKKQSKAQHRDGTFTSHQASPLPDEACKAWRNVITTLARELARRDHAAELIAAEQSTSAQTETRS